MTQQAMALPPKDRWDGIQDRAARAESDGDILPNFFFCIFPCLSKNGMIKINFEICLCYVTMGLSFLIC
jgi:hypothetical protein